MTSRSIAEIQAAIDCFKAECENITTMAHNNNGDSNNCRSQCFSSSSFQPDELEPTPIEEMASEAPLFLDQESNHDHHRVHEQEQPGFHTTFQYGNDSNHLQSTQPEIFTRNASMTSTGNQDYANNRYGPVGNQEGSEKILDLIQSLRRVGALPEINTESIDTGTHAKDYTPDHDQIANPSPHQWHEYAQPNENQTVQIGVVYHPVVTPYLPRGNDSHQILQFSESYDFQEKNYPMTSLLDASQFRHEENHVRKTHHHPIAKHKTSMTKKKKPKKKSTEDPNAVLPSLSPYNFFFREQREILIEQAKQTRDDLCSLNDLVKTHLGNKMDYTEQRKKDILEKHWYRDRTKRRRHRKTLECIDFKMLSKVIADLWHNLSSEGLAFYHGVAAADMHRYNEEMRKREIK